MHDKLQPFEEDILWAINKCQESGIDADENRLEDFAERVSIMHEGNVAIDLARDRAFKRVFYL